MRRCAKQGKGKMGANIFSVLMTILWSSVLITFFSFLRTRTRLLHMCGISTVILIYLFCAIRLAFPLEAPWAYEVSGGAVYNGIHVALTFKVGSVRIYEILFVIWIIGILISLTVYFIQYCMAMSYFQELPQEESRMGQEIMDGLDKDSRIRVLTLAGLRAPCCTGIIRKRVFLPEKTYSREDLRYIMLHEYTHLAHQDLLVKMLVRVLCGIYWWNPLVYLLKMDLTQSMEIRCDVSITEHLERKERADYLTLMLETFCEGGLPDKSVGVAGLVENRSKRLLERFSIVADTGIVQKKRAGVFAGVVMLLVLFVSYSVILQSKYEAPMSEIETDDKAYHVNIETSYIIKKGDTYVLYTEDMEIVLGEDAAVCLQEEEFVIKTDGYPLTGGKGY